MANDRPGQPAANPEKVYLDSTFYFDRLITHRPDHATACLVTAAWDAGEVEVVTSALTLAEVLYVPVTSAPDRSKVDRDREQDILDLFRQYEKRRFVLVEVDRAIAEAARDLVWDHNVRPKDAVHVASALRAHVSIMFTGDEQLVGLSGQVGGSPPLSISRPYWIVQTRLDDPLG